VPTNINDATYFELRLIQEVSSAKNLVFRFSKELSRYESLLKQSHGSNSQQKINIQERRLKNGLPIFLAHIKDVEAKLAESLKDIDWVGRQDLGERVADIDLVFSKEVTLPISIKSGGPGTERNLGGDSLRNLLGYDSKDIIEEMKSHTLQSLEFSFPKINFGTSWGQIRETIKSQSNSSIMQNTANIVGKKYQSKISDQIVAAWHSASEDQIIALVRYLSLQNDERDLGLKIFVAEESKAYVKGILDITNLVASDIKLIQHQNSINGTLEISIRGERYWRLNINFTNGIGLSPIAVRVFLL
jgi:hypothetical protein